ncbi:MAG TPA: hypothetical protein VLN91_03365 [Nitrospirota bacterium]|nr:hypothetical protein [Nitrospirota bacterium]
MAEVSILASDPYFDLGPNFRDFGLSGDPNGASKLDWSVFTQEMPEKQGEK